VIPRSKVVAIGRNYAAHAAELSNEVPEEPMMFLKPNTSVIGPGDQVFYPPQTQRVGVEIDYRSISGQLVRFADLLRRIDVGHLRVLALRAPAAHKIAAGTYE
jgi:hypothetical protein